MRHEWIESLLLGGGIAAAVLLIRELVTPSAPQHQLWALLLAGALLVLAQIALVLRARRQPARPADEPPEPRAPAPPRRPAPANPFARELSGGWTGLDEHIGEGHAAGADDQPANTAAPAPSTQSRFGEGHAAGADDQPANTAAPAPSTQSRYGIIQPNKPELERGDG